MYADQPNQQEASETARKIDDFDADKAMQRRKDEKVFKREFARDLRTFQ